MKLVFKQIRHNLTKKKESLIIVWLVTMISSFIYFFVQISIDGNTKFSQGLPDQQLTVALQSNTVLARVFLIVFLFILLFLYYMFFNRFMRDESKQLGCYGMLGFQRNFLSKVYMGIYSITMTTGTTVGFLLGYGATPILLKNYEISYNLSGLKKGLSLFNFVLGYFIPLVVIGAFIYFIIRKFTIKEVYSLLNYKDHKSEGVQKFSNAIASIFSGKLAYSMRIAFRKPVTILLILGSVFIFNILFLFSISLNQSSSLVLNSQLEGRNFSYLTQLDEIHYLDDNEDIPGVDFQLKEAGNLIINKQKIPQKAVGVTSTDSPFFELRLTGQSKSGRQTQSELRDGELVIGPRIHEIYHINKGDKGILEINGSEMPVIVSNIAENADNNVIYLSKTALEKFLGLRKGAYNAILSDKAPHLQDGTTLTIEQIKENLERDNVSNRLSAVICQVLAIIVGTLLLFAAILMNFEEKLASIMKLTILGYRSKEINRMLISIYVPILIVGFILLVYPSVLIGESISTSLSLETGDYMPFYTNGFIILIGFFVVMFIYYCIKGVFSMKVRKVIEKWDLISKRF